MLQILKIFWSLSLKKTSPWYVKASYLTTARKEINKKGFKTMQNVRNIICSWDLSTVISITLELERKHSHAAKAGRQQSIYYWSLLFAIGYTESPGLLLSSWKIRFRCLHILEYKEVSKSKENQIKQTKPTTMKTPSYSSNFILNWSHQRHSCCEEVKL